MPQGRGMREKGDAKYCFLTGNHKSQSVKHFSLQGLAKATLALWKCNTENSAQGQVTSGYMPRPFFPCHTWTFPLSGSLQDYSLSKDILITQEAHPPFSLFRCIWVFFKGSSQNSVPQKSKCQNTYKDFFLFCTYVSTTHIHATAHN